MRGIIIFILVGLAFAFISSAFVSKALSVAITHDMADNEIELLFGAVEAGPLTIARLQASVISQQGLVELMSNPALDHRNFRSVKIEGGADFSYNYGVWNSALTSSEKCLKKYEKHYQYSDSLNPFRIIIERDYCENLPEAQAIFAQSIVASLTVAVLAVIILSITVWPVATSIRQAEKSLGDAQIEISSIHFLPIKNLVEKARHNIKLEKQAAVADLIHQVAHDIRSPLSALNIFVSSSKSMSDEEKTFVESVSKRINEVANNLLLSNKTANISITKSSAKTNVSTVVEDVLREKRILTSDKKIQLLSEIKLDEASCSSIAPSTLASILSNLINNSIEAIPDEGIIQISVYELKDQIKIIIQDTGTGMSEETLSKLGNQNFSTKKMSNTSGSGLGFWNAKKVIESLGGSIEAQSKFGVGTLITLSLPITK